MARGDEGFDVAVGAGDRAFDEAEHAPAGPRAEPGADAVAYLAPHRWIAHHAEQEETTLKAACLALGYLTAEEFDEIVDPARMARPHDEDR